MTLLTMALALVAGLGLVQCFAGWAAVIRFAAAPAPAPRQLPPVTILRPLCGDEPLVPSIYWIGEIGMKPARSLVKSPLAVLSRNRRQGPCPRGKGTARVVPS